MKIILSDRERVWIPIILVALVVVGTVYFFTGSFTKISSPVVEDDITGTTSNSVSSTIVATSSQATQASIVVPHMTQFTDSTFGFSFWYPSSWTVTQEPVGSADDNGWFQGGTVVKRLNVFGPELPSGAEGVTIEEFHSAGLSITELGQTKSASPVGVDETIFFDPHTHLWMSKNLTDAPSGNAPAGTISVIDVTANNTMGGLHIFYGGKRFGAESIVPLSANNFLVISTRDVSNPNQRYLVNTVVATDPSVATPASASMQAQVIQNEAMQYGLVEGPIGDGQTFPAISVFASSQSVARGSTLLISWKSQIFPADSGVVLALLDSQSREVGVIAQNLDASGSYSWTVPTCTTTERNGAILLCHPTDSNGVYETPPGIYRLVARLYTPQGGYGGGMIAPSPKLAIIATSSAPSITVR